MRELVRTNEASLSVELAHDDRSGVLVSAQNARGVPEHVEISGLILPIISWTSEPPR
jgi:hypothetical protein